MMYDKFTISEKKELLKEVLKETTVKERFQDFFLGSEVVRFPLQINGKYAGRDLIFVYDFMKEIDQLKQGLLTVSFASPYYKIIKNQEIIQTVENELSDIGADFKRIDKKESVSDYSGLFQIGDDKGILIRNSYVPSRALSVFITVRRKVFIPIVKVRVIHTDKEVRKYNLELNEKLRDFTIITDVINELQKAKWSELPKGFLKEIEELRYVKYVTKKGFTEEREIMLGKDVIDKANRENLSALELIEETLVKAYETKRYTLKRKVDNIVATNIEKILNTVLSH